MFKNIFKKQTVEEFIEELYESRPKITRIMEGYPNHHNIFSVELLEVTVLDKTIYKLLIYAAIQKVNFREIYLGIDKQESIAKFKDFLKNYYV